DDEQRKSKDGREDGGGEAGKQQRHCHHDHELQNDAINRHQEQQVCFAEVVGCNQQGGVKAQGHEGGVYDQSQQKPEVLSYNELPAPDRAREDGIQGLFLNLLRHQSDPHQDRNDHAEQGNRGEADVDQDEPFQTNGYLAKQRCAGNQQQCKNNQVVQDAVPHSLAKSVESNGREAGSHELTGSSSFFFDKKEFSKVTRGGVTGMSRSGSCRHRYP